MIGPACREEMIVVEYKQIELDICAFCRGLWFDADELGLLLGALDLHVDEIGRPAPDKAAEEARKCPYCRARMAKVLMGPGDGVVIDKCPKGHGLWFDGGELDTVIEGLQKAGPAKKGREKAGGEVGSFLKDVLLAKQDDNNDNGEEK